MPGKKNKNKKEQNEEVAADQQPEESTVATQEQTAAPTDDQETKEQKPAEGEATTEEPKEEGEEVNKEAEKEEEQKPPPVPFRLRPDNGEADLADAPMAPFLSDASIAPLPELISDIELEYERRLKDLHAQIQFHDGNIAVLDHDIAQLPTTEEFIEEERDGRHEISVLEEQNAMMKTTVAMLLPIQDRGYALTARVHRLENYCVRCSIWVEQTFVAEVNAEIYNHRRNNELNVAKEIRDYQQKRERQQLAILELKDQIHENSSALTQGHTRLPRMEVSGFETVPTARSSAFGRMSVARTEARDDADTVNLRDMNSEVIENLIKVRQTIGTLSEEKSELSKELKRLKDQIQSELSMLNAELHRMESKMNSDRRVAAELEGSNATTTSTIEFLMTSLKQVRHNKKANSPPTSPAAITAH